MEVCPLPGPYMDERDAWNLGSDASKWNRFSEAMVPQKGRRDTTCNEEATNLKIWLSPYLYTLPLLYPLSAIIVILVGYILHPLPFPFHQAQIRLIGMATLPIVVSLRPGQFTIKN